MKVFMEDAKLFMLKNKLLGIDMNLYVDILELNGGSINTFETPDFIFGTSCNGKNFSSIEFY